MKLLVDCNIFIDYLEQRPEGLSAVSRIIDECQMHMLDSYIYCLSIPNIIYIERHLFPRAEREPLVNAILSGFTPVDFLSQDLTFPFKHDFSDYEDGLQSAAAVRIGADYIITHDLKGFANSPVPPITPEKFVKTVIATSAQK